jgi:hypothetical protein
MDANTAATCGRHMHHSVRPWVLLWLASKDIHLDRWIGKMLGLVEHSIITNQHIYWMLLGVFGLLGYAIGPAPDVSP